MITCRWFKCHMSDGQHENPECPGRNFDVIGTGETDEGYARRWKLTDDDQRATVEWLEARKTAAS